MGWIKRKIAQMVHDAMYDRSMEGTVAATPMSQVDRITHEAQMMISAIPINNGYLLRVERDRSRVMNSMQTPQPTLVYCKDAVEIAEQIVSHYTKDRLGIDPHVNINPASGLAKLTLTGGGGGGNIGSLSHSGLGVYSQQPTP